ncbi:hypothetical protein EDB81DRAFT_696223 [Dactylonectria macrodidyma]|uniref:BZIP domain-containing protein n=1 Tax=Dactylonectria macrodidyma TaxID=307937 RepID=A0A9P9E5F6_9HYPO|nr:hypothetical protein EDB81DRAFT_696223 [Dactylonectria macrodidyma]
MEVSRNGTGVLDAGTTRKSKLVRSRSRDDAGDDTPLPPKRRVLTTARREQNRLAQRAYRKRQKEDRQKLKQEPQLGIIRPLRPLVKRPVLGSSSTTGHHNITRPSQGELQVLLPEPIVDITRQEANEQDESELIMPDVYQNMLQFLPTTIFSAILHNALAMGFDLQKLSDCGPNFVSPFYQPNISSDSDPAALVQSSIASLTSTSIPPHLRPTIAQVLIPHHASLDLIPLPFLRQGAIMLSAAMPHAFNIHELKVDIYERGGLTIWQKDRATRYRRDERNSYQPWEMRSWEAAPWFLTKWCMAIGGEQSEFYRQSIGWQVIREVISAQAGT